MNTDYIYLASPYSHQNPHSMAIRAVLVEAAAAQLMKRGYVVYSPIAHCHHMAMLYDLPKTWPFWKEQDIPLVHHAAELHVLMIDGWEESVGVTAEIEYATSLGKPIVYWDPEELLNPVELPLSTAAA